MEGVSSEGYTLKWMELVQGQNKVNSDGDSLRMYSPETAGLDFSYDTIERGIPGSAWSA